MRNERRFTTRAICIVESIFVLKMNTFLDVNKSSVRYTTIQTEILFLLNFETSCRKLEFSSPKVIYIVIGWAKYKKEKDNIH